MSLWVASALLALGASIRLTRFITMDKLTFPLRRWLSQHGHTRVVVFITCPWCIGFWITLALVAVAWEVAPLRGAPWWFGIPSTALGFSYIVGMTADLEVEPEGD